MNLALRISRVLLSLVTVVCVSAQCAAASQVPLALDLLNPDSSAPKLLRPYMIQLRKIIESAWYPPAAPKSRRAKVFFQIGPRGELLQLNIQDTSGESAFDESTKRAISNSFPYSPPPRGEMRILNVVATFDSTFLSAAHFETHIPNSDYQGIPSHPQQPSLFIGQEGVTPNQPADDSRSKTYKSEQDRAVPSEPGQSVETSDQTVGQSAGELSGSLSDSFEVKSAKQVRALRPEELASYRQELKKWLDKPYDIRKGGH